MNRILVYGMVGTNRGGIETFLLKMNQYMEHTVFDYVIEEETCLHEEAIRAKGGEIYYITKRTKSPVQNLKDNRVLLKKLKGKIDAIYFNLSSLSWVGPIKMAVNEGYKVFVHSHNAQFIAANSSTLYRIVNRINKKRLSNWKINRLTCSKPATEFMFMPDDQVTMIYNAIKTDDFRFSPTVRKKIREELELSDKKIIGFVGRLNDQKNPLYLPVIMKAVCEENDNLVLIVLGDGPMKKRLEDDIQRNNLQDRIRLMGNVTNVNEYMQAMDLFILPSLHEGLPYVVVEAQTAGLKCILSDRITPEVNATGNVVFLPLTESADNWRTTIIESLQNSLNDREKWGSYMNNTAFNIEVQAKSLEQILLS